MVSMFRLICPGSTMSWVWSWARVGIGCGGGRIGEGCLEQEASVCVWGKDHVAGTERG